MDLKDKNLTETIIGCAYKIHGVLGSGFAEKVYENALMLELEQSGLNVVQQKSIAVFYNGQNVGDYVADLIIENKVICEIKAITELNTKHEVQLVNYLTATGIETGLLLNFADRVAVRRKFRTYKHPVNPETSC